MNPSPSAQDYEHLKRVLRVIEGARSRVYRVGENCSQTGQAVEHRTPLDEVIEREEHAEAEAAVESMNAAQMVLGLDTLPEPLAAVVRAYAAEAFRQMADEWLDWLFEEGANPLVVMKRLFALVKTKRPKLIWQMSFRDLGALFGETHAAMAMRCKVLFGETKAEWKKPLGARERMRVAQIGNCNRSGGKRLGQVAPPPPRLESGKFTASED